MAVGAVCQAGRHVLLTSIFDQFMDNDIFQYKEKQTVQGNRRENKNPSMIFFHFRHHHKLL